MSSFIARDEIEDRVTKALSRSRGAVLLGPRQSGKTTIARRIARRGRAEYFDLEDPSDVARLTAPKLTLERARGLVVLDEIQLRPDLLPLLRVLMDRQPLPAKFLLLGSAAPDLVRGASETLAGRVELVSMAGFRVTETGGGSRDRLWVRGGFPRRSWRRPTRTASRGGRVSCRRSSSATCGRWDSSWRPTPCAAFC